MRRKRDSLRASKKGILNKHRNPNSLQEFCLFYFPEKNANEFVFFWKIKNPQQCCGFLFAEKEGFEPPDLLQSIVFKTTAFDRSAISPVRLIRYSLNADANIETFFIIEK